MLRSLTSVLVIILIASALGSIPARADKARPSPPPDMRVEMNQAITIFTIQVFSTRSRHKAEEIVNDLKAKGLEAYFTVAGKATNLYRVRFGRYQSREQALKALNRFKRNASDVFPDAFLVQVDSLQVDEPSS